ncbi:Uncharacterized protein PECH_003168 [Penicillium ucsense]|uniref:Uncharacterized protein n=1 Tax=Penicillium ucsense TaxID=2839758 RepID=A0A8J8WHX2_9EURO|nr:Uncharacterized protein PECM_004891 [Penicillium ucsense]KAF7737678.1 Uncharacterized protein PECH_003168 [Penicillium ucsense]
MAGSRPSRVVSALVSTATSAAPQTSFSPELFPNYGSSGCLYSEVQFNIECQGETFGNIPAQMANLPNLRRLFVEARTEVEENEYSRTAFYNLVLFISSVAIFSLAAQRMSGPKVAR